MIRLVIPSEARYRIAMLWDYAIIPVTAAAGFIAGSSSLTFFAAACAAMSAGWLRHLRAVPFSLYAHADPRHPEVSTVLAAFRTALDAARQTRHPIRLRLTAFTSATCPRLRLELNRDGDLELVYGTGKLALKQPGVWLPDHPLPLVFPHTRSLALLFKACGATRVCVSQTSAPLFPNRLWCGLALLAALACALDIGWLLAAVLGFAFQTYLLEQQTHGTPHDARVQSG